jgi:hypothetical protein
MPAYNAERRLAEAVESILAQTFEDFEFLIIDDGSDDGTPEILQEYARKDARIRLERNERNLRIAATLNRGLALAAAPLIARMDADDVSLPNRLEKQVAFMRANPDIAVYSGGLAMYDAPDEIRLPPAEHEAICAQMFFASGIHHAVSIYRKELILAYAGGYDASMPPAEDYDLWARLSMHPGVRFANLPEVLYRYRHHDKNAQYAEQKQDKANLVRKKMLRTLGLTPGDEEFAAHLALSLWSKTLSRSELWTCKKWLDTFNAAARTVEPACGRKALERELKRRWRWLCENNIAACAFGLIYFRSAFADFSAKQMVIFMKRTIKKLLQRLFGTAA